MRTNAIYASLAAAALMAGCSTAQPLASAPAASQTGAQQAAPQIDTLGAPDLSHSKGQAEQLYTTEVSISSGKKTTVKWKPVVKAKPKPSTATAQGNTNPIPDPKCGDSVDVETSVPVDAIPASLISPESGPYSSAMTGSTPITTTGSYTGGGQVPGGSAPFGLPPGISTVKISLHAKQTVAYTDFYYQIPFAPGMNNALPGVPGVPGTPLSGLTGVNATGTLVIRDNAGDTITGQVHTILANPSDPSGSSYGRNMVATVSGTLNNGEQFVITVQDTNATNGLNVYPYTALHGALVSFSGSMLVGTMPGLNMTSFDLPYIFTSYIPFGNGNVEVELGNLCTSLTPFGMYPYNHP